MDNKMTMQEWIQQIQESQAEISTFGSSFPTASWSKMEKDALKKLNYKNLFIRLLNITMALFKWEVPDTFDARAMELGYINFGAVCAFRNKVGKFCLPCIPNNLYNIYANPTQVRTMGYNGFTEAINIKYKTDIPTGNIVQENPQVAEGEGVFSRDNDMMYPYINYIKEYAYKISDKLVALNIATQRLKSPFTYVVDEAELRDTVKKMSEKIESNDDVIIIIKPNKMKPIQESIQLQPNNMKPEIVQSIKDAVLFDFNMFLETIGINTNPSPDKSQVVLTPELNSNNTLIDIERKIRLKNREKFCEDCKDLLGVTMSVKENMEEAEQMANQFRQGVQGYGAQAKPNEAKQPTS